MIEFRWLTRTESAQGPGDAPITRERRVLQFRYTLGPRYIIGGDIVLFVVDSPEWQDVPEEYEP